MTSNTYVITKDGDRIVKLIKTDGVQNQNVIGVMSNIANAGDFNSIGYNINPSDNPKPLALSGRVYVNLDTNSPDINPGDMITVSSVPGKGTKAVGAGFVVGKALESWTPSSGKTKVMIYIMNMYYNPNLEASAFILNSNTLSTNYSLTVNGNITANSLNIGNGNFIVSSKGSVTANALISATKAIIKDLTIEKLTINTLASGDVVIGSGKVLQGQKKIFINNTNVTANSKIFITIRTSNSDFDTIAVSNVQDGIGFEASIKQININNDTDFDYWIIN